MMTATGDTQKEKEKSSSIKKQERSSHAPSLETSWLRYVCQTWIHCGCLSLVSSRLMALLYRTIKDQVFCKASVSGCFHGLF